MFRRMLDELLGPRLAAAPPEAVIIPFGVVAASGVEYLIRQQVIPSSRVLLRFPHPSGSNGHRVKSFARYKDELAESVASLFRA